MAIYKVTEKTGYSSSWILLAVLFIAAVLGWLLSPLYTLVMAIIGFIAAGYFRKQGKKIIGDQIEITDKGITFTQGDHSNCVAFNEIKNIKEMRKLFSDPFYQITTKQQNSYKLQPEYYEDGDIMRDKLLQAFAKYDCVIEK